MTQYLLSIYQPDGEPPPPEILGPIMQKVGEFIDETKRTGAWVFNGGLYPPSSATVVRMNGADVLTTDGPYIEGKEHIGGFCIVRAEDLDAALEWGRKLARAIPPLAIEVRPFRSEEQHRSGNHH